jgi:predicted GIY-YIG superfamily endonuclease
MVIYIYALLDPDTEEVRYIGKTNDLNKRMSGHCTVNRNPKTHKARWINKLIAQGKTPKMLVIEECNEDTWEEAECRWIAHYRTVNNKLTNIADGGRGNRMTAEYRTADRPALTEAITALITSSMRKELDDLVVQTGIKQGEIVRRALQIGLKKLRRQLEKESTTDS